MYYSGYFRNTDTSTDEAGQLFKVVIITNFIKEEFKYGGELMLSDSPFTVSYESEDGNIFKPYKCSSATVRLYQNNYNFDFNTSKGNNVLVMLLRFKNERKETEIKESELNATYDRQLQIDNICYSVEWIGYATPNVYSQEFQNLYDLFELECQDALSTLQYFPYKLINNQQKPFISFIELLKELICIVKAYKNIYISETLKIPTIEDGDIFHFLYLDQRNFFDEDEKAISSLEVIEEICKYLNLSIIPYCNSLYIVDYNGIKNNFNDYYKYSIIKKEYYPFTINNEFVLDSNKITLCDISNIVKEDFSNNGTNINLQSIVNKYSVKDSLYSYDAVEPNLEDVSKLIETAIIDEPRVLEGGLSIGGQIQITNGLILSEVGNKYITDENYVGFLDDSYKQFVEHIVKSDGTKLIVKHENLDDKLNVFCGHINGKFQKIYVKYLGYENTDSIIDDSTLITYWYEQDKVNGKIIEYGKENLIINKNRNWCWNTQANYVGSQLLQYNIKTIENREEYGKHPKKLKMKPCIIMCSRQVGKNRNMIINNSQTQKMFTIRTKSLSLGSGDYIIINASMKFYATGEMIPTEVEEWGEIQYNKQNVSATFKHFGSSKIESFTGNNWVNGDNENFDIELDCKIGDKGAFYKEHKLKSTYINEEYNYKDLFGVESGLIIPSPTAFSEDDVIIGQFEFTFNRPYGLNDYQYYYCQVEDIEIKVITQTEFNGYIASNDDTDTEYSNVIEDDVVEVELNTESKITTWDKKQPNYSSVFFSRYLDSFQGLLANSEFLRLKHIFNKSTGEVLRAEEHIIQNMVNQYSNPTININLNLHNSPTPYSVFKYHFFNDKLFIVDGGEFDYVNNSYNFNIVEKK